MKLTHGLSDAEVQCRCGCMQGFLTLPTLIRYTALRIFINRGLHISSAYRCPVHNMNEKGSPVSQHMIGRALDIHRPKNMDQQVFRKICGMFFETVISYEWGCHVDTRTDDCSIENIKAVVKLCHSILKQN